MLKIIKKIPLLNCLPSLYVCTFFENHNYSFLKNCCKEIELFDCNLSKRVKIITCYQYSYFCSLKSKTGFLAIKPVDQQHIFILDSNYNEINRITLRIPYIFRGQIKAIAYDEKRCKILVITSNKFYSINIDGDFIKEELQKHTLEGLSTKMNRSKLIKGLNGCCGVTNYTAFHPDLTTIGIICDKVFIAYVKDNSCYISEVSTNGNIIDTFYIDDDAVINSIFEVNGNIQLLVTKADSYNYIYISDYYCKADCLKNYCKICTVPRCNQYCQHDCHKNYDDIIDSVDLIESSLSHILNSGREKQLILNQDFFN